MNPGCTVVTGASSGIGAEVARRLIARGEPVLAVARREDRLRTLCAASENARYLVCDLAEPEAVAAVAAAVKENFGAVRGFVHCAGFNAVAPLSLVDAAAAQRLYAVHALFPMRFLGWLAKAPNHVAGTACVLVSSVACHEGGMGKGNAAYAAAKGAVEGMLKGASAELADRGVRLNAVAPGVVDTEMARTVWMADATSDLPDAKRAGCALGKCEAVADVIEFFLGEHSAWVNGQCLIVDGGRSATA